MNKVTIITPTFKRDPSIVKRCIASVRSQTHENWEHLICSDGILEPQIRELITHEDDARREYKVTSRHYNDYGGGVRNEAIHEFMHGDYVMFLDDDNIIMPNYLEKMVMALERSKNDEQFAICQIMHWGGLPDFWGEPPVLIKGEPKIGYIDTLQVMVRADVMREIGWLYKKGYCADGFTYEKLASRYSFVRVHECLGIHFQ